MHRDQTHAIQWRRSELSRLETVYQDLEKRFPQLHETFDLQREDTNPLRNTFPSPRIYRLSEHRQAVTHFSTQQHLIHIQRMFAYQSLAQAVDAVSKEHGLPTNDVISELSDEVMRVAFPSKALGEAYFGDVIRLHTLEFELQDAIKKPIPQDAVSSAREALVSFCDQELHRLY